MRKVIVGAMVSMDGVMQAPGGPEEDPTGGFKFGWVAPAADTGADLVREGENGFSFRSAIPTRSSAACARCATIRSASRS